MTVKELFEYGKGDNDIVLCVNDNEFYALENGFSSPVYNSERVYELLEEWEADEDSVVVLN